MLVTDCLLKAECNFRVQFVVMERVQEGCGVRKLATTGCGIIMCTNRPVLFKYNRSLSK